MTYEEAVQHRKALTEIQKMGNIDLRIWLALAEDELRSTLGDGSLLLARFTEIRTDAEKQLSDTNDLEKKKTEAQIRPNCSALIDLVGARLDSIPSPPESLKEEIDLAIQKGYFKSVYFRAIAVSFGVLLFLITGVATFKVTTQVEAMQKLLDEASQQMAQSKDRQAQIALALLQGNEDIVRLRTGALTEMANQEAAFKQTVGTETTTWVDKITKADGPEASKSIETAGNQAKAELARKIASTLDALEATRHPWVPAVVWSMAKTWLLVPVALIVAILAWLSTFTRNLHQYKGVKVGNVLASVNVLLLLTTLALLWKLK
jgi:hypothetical protein